MNKRSAVLMALALTGALVAGGFALASGIGGPAANAASGRVAKTKRAKPIVRTKTRTVTIHRKANQPDGRVVVLGGGSPASGTGTGSSFGSTSGSSGDDGIESEGETEGPDDAVEDSGIDSTNSVSTSSENGGGDD